MMKQRKLICLLMVLYSLTAGVSRAEIRGAWSADASAAVAATDLTLGYSFNYNLWLNKYMSVYFGGLFTHGFSDSGASWTGISGTEYEFPECLKTRHLNAQTGILFYTPSLLKTGFYGGGRAFFDIIPFNFVSVKKVVGQDGIMETTRDVDKFRFNNFAPGAFAEIGLYHDFVSRKNPDKAVRFSIGYGYGRYDPFAAYRCAWIDGVRIGSKMESGNRIYQQITLRLTGLTDR